MIGRALCAPAEGERHVFSNDPGIFWGLKLAVKNRVLEAGNLIILFWRDGQSFPDSLSEDGMQVYPGAMVDGFFDQSEKDLLELIDGFSKPRPSLLSTRDDGHPRLWLHCGDYAAAPLFTQVIGRLFATEYEMSQIGRGLTIPEGPDDRHVFSNNLNICHGIRLAVAEGSIDRNHLVVAYHHEGTTFEAWFDAQGRWDFSNPIPVGLFDQAESDCLELF